MKANKDYYEGALVGYLSHSRGIKFTQEEGNKTISVTSRIGIKQWGMIDFLIHKKGYSLIAMPGWSK